LNFINFLGLNNEDGSCEMKIEMGALRLYSGSQMVVNSHLSLLGLIGKASRPLLESAERKRKRVLAGIELASIEDNRFLLDELLSLFVQSDLEVLIVCSANDLWPEFAIIILFRGTLGHLYPLYKCLCTSA
jgi:hypothetical protein